MENYIVYLPNGFGCFLASDPVADLNAAKEATPSGGHVEQITSTGSVVVFTAP